MKEGLFLICYGTQSIVDTVVSLLVPIGFVITLSVNKVIINLLYHIIAAQDLYRCGCLA